MGRSGSWNLPAPAAAARWVRGSNPLKYPRAGQQDHGTRRGRNLKLQHPSSERGHLPEAEQQTAAQQTLWLACNGGLKITTQDCHLAVLNHTGQHAVNPLTHKRAPGQDLPLGRCLLAHPGFQSSGLHQPGLWAPKWQGRCWEGNRAELPCRAVASSAGRRYPPQARTLQRDASLGGFIGPPTQGTPGTHSAGLRNFGAPQEFASLGHATWGHPGPAAPGCTGTCKHRGAPAT